MYPPLTYVDGTTAPLLAGTEAKTATTSAAEKRHRQRNSAVPATQRFVASVGTVKVTLPGHCPERFHCRSDISAACYNHPKRIRLTRINWSMRMGGGGGKTYLQLNIELNFDQRNPAVASPRVPFPDAVPLF